MYTKTLSAIALTFLLGACSGQETLTTEAAPEAAAETKAAVVVAETNTTVDTVTVETNATVETVDADVNATVAAPLESSDTNATEAK